MKKLAQLLGLAAKATQEQIEDAAIAVLEKVNAWRGRLIASLKIEADANDDQIEGAIVKLVIQNESLAAQNAEIKEINGKGAEQNKLLTNQVDSLEAANAYLSEVNSNLKSELQAALDSIGGSNKAVDPKQTAEFTKLVKEKMSLGLSRELAEEVSRNQIAHNAEQAKASKK
jgi:hypothetical protein